MPTHVGTGKEANYIMSSFPNKSDLFAYWPVFIKPEPLFCCGLYKICILEHECSGAAIYRIDPFQSVKRLTFL